MSEYHAKLWQFCLLLFKAHLNGCTWFKGILAIDNDLEIRSSLQNGKYSLPFLEVLRNEHEYYLC